MNAAGYQFGQHMVNQTPKFEKAVYKGRRENQVMSKSGIIRRDKRKKHKFF